MKKRSDMISLLRVIATLMVVAVHCGQALPLPSLMHQIVLRGKYGVVLFYVLCGFLALKALSYNNSAKEYYKKAFSNCPNLLFEFVYKYINCGSIR